MFVGGDGDLLADEVFDLHFLAVGVDDLGGGGEGDFFAADLEGLLLGVIGGEFTRDRDFHTATGVDGSGKGDDGEDGEQFFHKGSRIRESETIRI